MIDSGELEYPAPYAAATFTDTFDLADSTSIHLRNGGGIRVNAGSIAQDNIVGTSNKDLYIANPGAPNGVASFRLNGAFSNANLAVSPTNTNIGFSISANIGATTTTSSIDTIRPSAVWTKTSNSNTDPSALEDVTYFEVGYMSPSDRGNADIIESVKGFNVPRNLGRNVTENDSSLQVANTSYGFYSDLNFTSGDALAAGQQKFNFYAAGSASNWFAGDVTGGGTNGANAVWSIAADGTADGITVTRASVVTDEQAGTVETLLDIITDLRARVAALEAGNGGY